MPSFLLNNMLAAYCDEMSKIVFTLFDSQSSIVGNEQI